MTIRILPLTVAALALFVAVPAHAAKEKKGGGGRVLSHMDRDHNGTIDGKEATRVQAMYAALAALDTNHDGQLSESELAAAKIPAASAKKKKKAQ